MKTIILNGSPRNNWNTAQLLKSAREGAASVGSETEYINLYDMNFTGCRGCLACKRKGAVRCKCFWKDDLSPLLDRIFDADALIIGIPNYLGDITSQVQALIERLVFCCLSYDDYANYYKGKVNMGVILTMNATQDYYEKVYREKFTNRLEKLHHTLNGTMEIQPCFDTLQVKDYFKYSMSSFNEDHKKARHDEQFNSDLDQAFQMGVKLGARK